MWMFGFSQKADGIPLTRSKQDRNLVELGELVIRLRELPVDRVDDELLADAFMRTHSTAEVYRLDAIQAVFGDLAGLAPTTQARLLQTMRRNLASLWRDPREQHDKKTRRSDQEIQAQVLRGYGVAARLANTGLAAHPESWELLLVRAALLFDQNGYQNLELGRSSTYTATRARAFEAFAEAARAYAAAVPDLPLEDETTEVYDLWFYASLGASDLARVSHDQVPDLRQPEAIRAALQALPGEAAERHMRVFANALFSRMSAASPEIKVRYLRSGFMVVEDHPDAREARDVFTYYQDLITELELQVQVDGSDRVGHERPFGLFVNIRHTREIERESGGFGKYLQNQNAMSFSWNYGRPTEDYRDKFQEAATEILGEHFEVISFTFHEPDVESRGDPQTGWRITPYCYVLLKPRGPEVDTVPSLSIDFDFLDTSGYAVLPIASPPLPLDARAPAGDPRPLTRLELIQTLDERRSGEGLLVVEVKATGLGLIPPLDDLLEFEDATFEITDVEDQGVSVSHVDVEGQDLAAVTERLWLVELRGKQGLEQLPETFQFAVAKREATVTYQRYDDADLVDVTELVNLEETYGEQASAWPWVALVAALLFGGLLLALRVGRQPVVPRAASAYRLPERVTPVTVLQLLQRIRDDGAVGPETAELQAAISKLERAYFAPGESNGDTDLRGLAVRWAERASPPA
jgi:hypothetical protein